MKKTAFLLSFLLTAGLSVSACGDPQDPCEVNPTRQAANGEWVEADGEPLDSDPCDSDDSGGHGSKKKPSTKKKK